MRIVKIRIIEELNHSGHPFRYMLEYNDSVRWKLLYEPTHDVRQVNVAVANTPHKIKEKLLSILDKGELIVDEYPTVKRYKLIKNKI